jgi:ubiquinone/menaquinone biosynthesis C-methylase UbiE
MLENPRIYEFVQKLLGEDRVYKAVKEAVELQLKDISYGTVLDVGCGTGLFLELFNSEYTGVDINAEYIEMARKKGRGCYLAADATNLPFEAESYDMVFTVGVLHHLDLNNREMMLHEMSRVCKTGGHILIVDGLIPANRLNLIGFTLARLDRGGFKMRIEEFREMLDSARPGAKWINETRIKSFPYELVAVLLRK